MLVLTRKKLERILIGPDIVLTVLRISLGEVQLGLEAPKATLILRGELKPRKGGGDPK